MKKLGLVLSGGGGRGSAHVGLLQALNENGIFPDAISGTSAGALIGALYCHGYSPLHILEMSKSEDFLEIFKMTILPNKWNKLNGIRELLKRSIPADRFEALRIPLYVCVTNLNTGKSEYINTGELINYVIASCAVPIIFNPIVIGNISYVDGGVLNNLPIEPLRHLEMKIIGVSICPHRELENISGIRAISERLFHLEVWNNTSGRLSQCDIVIDMEKTFDYGMFDVSHSDELYQIGYDTTMAKMSEIKETLST